MAEQGAVAGLECRRVLGRPGSQVPWEFLVTLAQEALAVVPTANREFQDQCKAAVPMEPRDYTERTVMRAQLRQFPRHQSWV